MVKERYDYLSLCITYRMIAALLSTFAYLYTSYSAGERLEFSGWIAIGMLASCFVANFLYNYFGSMSGWGRYVFILEVIAYGLFMLMSGGLKSAYLWYFISCLIIAMIDEGSLGIGSFGMMWLMICAISGSLIKPMEYSAVNIFIAMLLLIGSLFIIRIYIGLQKQQQEDLEKLNIRLGEEKSRTQYALAKSTDMYASFDILALSNPDQIIHSLVDLMVKSIAPAGCMLIKLDLDGEIERVETPGLSEELVEVLSEQVFAPGWLSGVRNRLYMPNGIEAGGYSFEVIGLAKDSYLSGVLLRRVLPGNVYDNEDFYIHLAEIVFSMLDMYSRIEEYITVEEKNRIAGEIHDTVLQKLFGIQCKLTELEGILETGPSSLLLEKISVLQEAAKTTMADLRAAIYGIRFDESSGEGFIKRLQSYMDEIGLLNSVHIETRFMDDTREIGPAQKTVIYRIACEAVNNAVKHGKACRILVRLFREKNEIRLWVLNDGLDFDAAAAGQSEGMGIKNMQRLAKMLNGELTIQSGEYVQVDLRLPYQERRGS